MFGAVKKGKLDISATKVLIDACAGFQTTFHMAFDEIKPHLQFVAIDWLAEQGVTRILTHGGAVNQPIESHLARLQDYIQYAGDRIGILPGGGINDVNLNRVHQMLNNCQYHGTKIIRF